MTKLMKDGKEIDALALGDKEFYPIGSSDTSVTANGKTYYAVPSKITIKQGTSLTYPSRGTVESGDSDTLSQDSEVDCVGVSANHYFFEGTPIPYGYTYWEDDEGYGVGEVLKSDCKSVVW